MPPTQAKKVAVALGVATLACAIVSNASTSGIILSTTQSGITETIEIGIWMFKIDISGDGGDLSATNTTKCTPDNGCGGNTCCISHSDRCQTLQAFAVFGV
jgi:hypothetical protein